jgi:hypothetical protein
MHHDTNLRDVQVRREFRVMGDTTCFVGVVEDEAGVNGAGTSCAGEAVEGGETHGSVKGLAVLDGAGGCTRAEMEDDEVQCGRWFLEKMGYGAEDECIWRKLVK